MSFKVEVLILAAVVDTVSLVEQELLSGASAVYCMPTDLAHALTYIPIGQEDQKHFALQHSVIHIQFSPKTM